MSSTECVNSSDTRFAILHLLYSQAKRNLQVELMKNFVVNLAIEVLTRSVDVDLSGYLTSLSVQG